MLVCGGFPQDIDAQQVKLEKPSGKLAKGSQAKCVQKPNAAAAAALTLEAIEQPATSGRTLAEATTQDWTEEQTVALQRAYLTVKPSQRNFWQHVAKLVQGKTALECCTCKFDELPTPVEKMKQSSRHAAARDSSPIRPPALKVTGGEHYVWKCVKCPMSSLIGNPHSMVLP